MYLVCSYIPTPLSLFFFFFFNDTATTEIYTLSLHDALPICARHARNRLRGRRGTARPGVGQRRADLDRKSTRLNSSHSQISYAVFCLKKKKKKTRRTQPRAHTVHNVRKLHDARRRQQDALL